MPRPTRDLQEVESVKNEIIDEALKIITDYGYDFFSMRKLASRLGIAAKTIYNYFQNKDELYLRVLQKGFEKLYNQCLAAISSAKTPSEKLMAMGRAYLSFGLENPHYYDIMFSLDVPKYPDYLGTGLEQAAREENETALQVATLARDSLAELGRSSGLLGPGDVDLALFNLWSSLHGMVSLCNSRVTVEVFTVDPEMMERNLAMALRALTPYPPA